MAKAIPGRVLIHSSVLLLITSSLLPPAAHGTPGAPTVGDLPDAAASGELSFSLTLFKNSTYRYECNSNGSLQNENCRGGGGSFSDLVDLDECVLRTLGLNPRPPLSGACGEGSVTQSSRATWRPLLREQVSRTLARVAAVLGLGDAPMEEPPWTPPAPPPAPLLGASQGGWTAGGRSRENGTYLSLSLYLHYGGAEGPTFAEFCVDHICAPHAGVPLDMLLELSALGPALVLASVADLARSAEATAEDARTALTRALAPYLGAPMPDLSPPTPPPAPAPPETPEAPGTPDAPQPPGAPGASDAPDPKGTGSAALDVWLLKPDTDATDPAATALALPGESPGGARVGTSGELGDRNETLEVPAAASLLAPQARVIPGTQEPLGDARPRAEGSPGEPLVPRPFFIFPASARDAPEATAPPGGKLQWITPAAASARQARAAVPGEATDLQGTVAAATLAASLALIAAGLYSRLRKDRLLENDLRSRLFNLVQSEPGLSTSDAARALGVHASTVDYHARRLSMEGYLRTIRSGKVRLLWPAEAGALDEAEVVERYWRRDATKRRVLEALEGSPARSRSDLAEVLGVNRRTLADHLEILATAGIVARERKGRVILYRLQRGAGEGGAG